MLVCGSHTNRLIQSKGFRKGQTRIFAKSDVNTNGTNVRSASHWTDLKDPYHIWATGDKSIRVKNDFKRASLEDYMRLPVSQYSVLDPRLITSTGSDSFAFSVPKLEFFNEWVKPSVQAKVVQSGNRVHIRTQKAEMDVSSLVASFNLDQRWFMIFEATLTWENDAEDSEETMRGFGRTLGNEDGSWTRSGMIHGRSRVDVWCEIGPEFSALRELLQNACNLALAALMRTLMPVFMTRLADDYTKWASDEKYRKEREMWELAPAT